MRKSRSQYMKSTRINKTSWAVWGKVVACLILLPALALGQSRRMSKDLEKLPAAQTVNVIVQYRVVPTQSHFDRVQARGGVLQRDLRGMKAGAFLVSAGALTRLANDPDVA